MYFLAPVTSSKILYKLFLSQDSKIEPEFKFAASDIEVKNPMENVNPYTEGNFTLTNFYSNFLNMLL